jgi:hypothetical protein
MSNVVSMGKGEMAVIDPGIIESIVTKGDLSGLNQQQKVAYYNYRCQQIGLDPSAKPFDLLNLSGKQVLYANAGATQQLCSMHKLSTQITHRERVDDIYLVSCRVTGADGRISENQGAVSVANLKGDALANAILKATTKAIRRSVLAHCGLGMLDETEVEAIPGAQTAVLDIKDPTPIKPPAMPVKKESGEAFYVPGNPEPYDYCDTQEEWADKFLTMVEKIAESKKFTIEDKLFKIGELEKCNDLMIAQIRNDKHGLYEVLSHGIGQTRLALGQEQKK